MGWRVRGEVDRDSTSQASTDGPGEVKAAAGVVCRPDAEGTRKSHLGGEKSIIVHKYYLRYQPAVHNHMGGCLRTKGKEGTAKENTGDGMRVGIYYGANPRIQGRVAGEKTLLSAIIMTVIVWSSDVCLETTHSRTRRPHSSIVHAS